ncbi:hypothetical protein V1525DRAFT_392314 [Lipomyces kononenkoae]|uniref:Uncharacterized protein n=1 Tax=Lipomyces kononenkoae TaxID=34357 RepID=A0ACC3TC11_LIPKO
MAHQLVSMPEGNDTSKVFKRHLDGSCDVNVSDESAGITSTVLSPKIHIVPPQYDNPRDNTNPEGLRRKRRMGDDDTMTTTPCDSSSDTLLDEDTEMRDDTTYVDCDDLEEDENVVESVVELCKTGEFVGAHVPEYWQPKNHFVRLWQSIASRIDHNGDGSTSPLRYLAGWANENRRRDHLAQKRRAYVSSGSSEDRSWAGTSSKRRRSSAADSPVDMAISNDDYMASRNSHWHTSMSSCDIHRSPLRQNNESGLPRYYPGGWPTPPSEHDETSDNDEDDEDGTMDTGNDGCDMLISSELALDAQVMGPSVSEYFILDSDDRSSLEVNVVTPDSDDEYDDEDAEYFHDFGSLLQSLRDVAKGCTSSVGSPSSSTGFSSSKRPPMIVIDYDSSIKKDDNGSKITEDDDDEEDHDIGVRGAARVDYDDCSLARVADDENMTGENDGFEIVARDDDTS